MKYLVEIETDGNETISDLTYGLNKLVLNNANVIRARFLPDDYLEQGGKFKAEAEALIDRIEMNIETYRKEVSE